MTKHLRDTMTKNTRNTRREFLIATVGVGVCSVTGLGQSRSPSDKLNIGFIGVAGRGGQNMAEMAGENVAALCDVDAQHLGQAVERFPKARQYRDFRKMIDEARDLDAVVISTPHHIHAAATARALRAGKHVYCEKPLTHTVWEARMVAELAAKHKVATQHGTNAHIIVMRAMTSAESVASTSSDVRPIHRSLGRILCKLVASATTSSAERWCISRASISPWSRGSSAVSALSWSSS